MDILLLIVCFLYITHCQIESYINRQSWTRSKKPHIYDIILLSYFRIENVQEQWFVSTYSLLDFSVFQENVHVRNGLSENILYEFVGCMTLHEMIYKSFFQNVDNLKSLNSNIGYLQRFLHNFSINPYNIHSFLQNFFPI